jgi:hypothetical protein
MAPQTKRWIIFVDHRFKAIASSFPVNTTVRDTVWDLKEKAIKVSGMHFLAVKASMWKTKDTNVINTETTFERTEEILRSINVDDKDTIERVNESSRVTSLGLSDDQVLLTQLIGTSSCTYTAIGCVLILGIGATSSEDDAIGPAVTSKLNPVYKDATLHAHGRGNFIEADFSSNYVKDETGQVPEFVRKYEEMLGRKRKVLIDVRCFRIISCFRLLTDEVRCHLWMKRFSRSTLIVRRKIQRRIRQRIPLGPLPLPTDSRLNTL